MKLFKLTMKDFNISPKTYEVTHDFKNYLGVNTKQKFQYHSLVYKTQNPNTLDGHSCSYRTQALQPHLPSTASVPWNVHHLQGNELPLQWYYPLPSQATDSLPSADVILSLERSSPPLSYHSLPAKTHPYRNQ